MAFLSWLELFDIVLMSLVVGYIFKDTFRAPTRTPEDYLKNVTPGLKNKMHSLFGLNDFWVAVIIVAPSIVFHEFGHKFVAMAFGAVATFHAAYTWLAVGVLLKLILPGFVFFVPAYVEFGTAGLSELQGSLIAFAGPAINGLFWLAAAVIMWHAKRTKRKLKAATLRFLFFFRYINGFLFIFNMIPIPGFDGFHILYGIWQAIF